MRIARIKYFVLINLIIISAVFLSKDFHEGNTPEEIRKAEILRKHNRVKKAAKKYNDPNEYYKYHAGIRYNSNAPDKEYAQSYLNDELDLAKQNPVFGSKRALRTQGLEFKERGPFNVPGRTRTIITLPDDPENHWLAGAVGGGIWETENAGILWINRTQDIPSLAVSCMENCRESPDIIYAGTGEGYYNIDALDGAGILKSVDAGKSWSILESTSFDEKFGVVTRIVVDHDDPDILLASTISRASTSLANSLILKSVNGGVTWDIVYESPYRITQIISNPENSSTLYASHLNFVTRTAAVPNEVILKSTDGGESWEPSGQGISSVIGRVELAIAPSDTNYVYASAEGTLSGATADLFVSSDGGNSWQLVNQEYDDEAVDFFDGQGWYDNTVAVNPFNELEVYYGGVNLWRSNILPGNTLQKRHVIDVSFYREKNTMWSLVNFGADYYNGKIELSTELGIEEFSSVAIVTGVDIKQKAYRFTVDKSGSGVPDEDYKYQDYVDVPFQVWDIENDRQLMVSFRDQQEDSVFNLLEQNTLDGEEELHSREYIYIHTVDYSETSSSLIARDGGDKQGHKYKNMYFMWPVLADGLVWDEAKLVSDTFFISHEFVESFVIEGEMINISDAYRNYSSINTISAAFENALHPDHHFLKMIPINPDSKSFKILSANDGGIFSSNISASPGSNNGDWTFSGYGYNTGQFYGAAKQPGSEVFIGGLQDNGTWKSPDDDNAASDTEYEFQVGGDGFDVIWHARRPRQIIASSQFNAFKRTKNGGSSWESVGEEMKGVKPFLSKISNSNANPEALFTVTSDGVYRSPDFGSNWILSPIDNNWEFSSYTRVEVSLSNPEIIWAGSGMSGNNKMHVSTNGGVSFVEVKNFSTEAYPSISGLATHPFEDSTAYVLFSYPKDTKIIRTTDLGETWEDISGFNENELSSNGFPDVAVLSLLVRPDAPEIIWAGTEIGIFESNDNGASWYLLDNMMGAAAVWDMTVMDDQVVLATHGRGIFTATLNELIEITYKPEMIGAGMDPEGVFNISATLPSTYDSTAVYINDTFIYMSAGSTTGKATYSITGLDPDDSVAVNLMAYRKGKKYVSESISATIFNVEEPVTFYSTDFETKQDEFAGFGFSVTDYTDFDDFSMHSEHPYIAANELGLESIDLVYYLRTPIVISEKNSWIYYDHVALLEPGSVGSAFPSVNFLDYVVIEGTANGIDWSPLSPGYDAGKNSAWKTAYVANEDGSQALMQTMKIGTKDVFSVGETILVRFRLHSDADHVGWGWAIDNLFIQSIITGIGEENFTNNEISIFPNPAHHILNVRNLPNHENSELLIYNLGGAVVKKMKVSPSISHDLSIDISDVQKGVYVVKLKSPDHEYTSRLIVQ